MKVPSIVEAECLLHEAEQLNPGIWVDHCKVAGQCAKVIAMRCNDMDSDIAYVLGLLHDIGRRVGICDKKHILSGYQFMMEKGYDDCARICLTHTFPYKNIHSCGGKNDISEEEMAFMQEQLNNIVYNDYDILIQLSDVLAFSTGPCVIEKRLIEYHIRRGINDLTVEHFKATLKAKEYFEEKIGCNIYSLFDDLIL